MSDDTSSGDCPDEKRGFLIHYCHENCPVSPGVEWQDVWDCTCNGQCPACGTKDIEPTRWEDVEEESEEKR